MIVNCFDYLREIMTDTTTSSAVGSVFPALRLVDSDGVATDGIPLAPGGTIVHFMRSSTCPVCLGHAAVIDQLVRSGSLGDARVVFIAPGGAEEAAEASVRMRGRAIAVYASGDAHRDAGLGRFLALQHSGTFVLDADGAVLSAVTATIPTASFSRAELVRVLPIGTEQGAD